MPSKVKDTPGNDNSALFAESVHVLAACKCGACNNVYEASSGGQLFCFAGLQTLFVCSQTCSQCVDDTWHQCAGSIVLASFLLLLLLLLRLLLLPLCRQKEDLEQVSVVMQDEKLKLQEEAEKLAQQLQAVLNDKFVRRNTFDAETPIDKTLGYLETIISVSLPFQWPAVLIVAAPSFLLRSA